MTFTDDESMPTIRCPSCSKWHHRSCLTTSELQGGLCGRFNDFNDVMENFASLKSAPAVPTITWRLGYNYRQVSKIHYAEFARYLAHPVSYKCTDHPFFFQFNRRLVPAFKFSIQVYPNFRSTARSKLSRLENGVFFEISTDLYEELMRRNYQNEGTSCKPDMIPVLVILFSPSPISSRHRRISTATKSGTPKDGNNTYISFQGSFR